MQTMDQFILVMLVKLFELCKWKYFELFLGIALLYTHLAVVFPDRQTHYLEKAKSLINIAVKHLDGKLIISISIVCLVVLWK